MSRKTRKIPIEDREPDTARSYERAKPEKEAGMGRLDNNPATPERKPDALAPGGQRRAPRPDPQRRDDDS
jgi:hypothetical protein